MRSQKMYKIIEEQKKYFASGKTLAYEARKNCLTKLRQEILRQEEAICEALKADLGKSATESYMSEIGMVLDDIRFQLKHLKRNMRNKRVKTPLAQFLAKSYVKPSPYGQVLVLAPWNYPFLLAIEPLVGAVASGNVVVLKPSEFAPQTALIMQKIIANVFLPEHATTILGEADVATQLVSLKWDYIFFTGGTKIGQLVYEAASHNLTPVTLELGGKSPVIVDQTANLKLAARRIVFGKFLNCGQTCVAPDYLLVQESVANQLINLLKDNIKLLYNEALTNKDYGNIINERQYKRLLGYLKDANIIFGGKVDASTRKIEPTLLFPVDSNSSVMKEEIFGPILPIITYQHEEEIYSIVAKSPTPLALYLFSTNKKMIREITTKISFGGGCINDTIIHLATSYMPFGGVGNSGIGSYHGNKSFATFTHFKSIVNKSNLLDLPIRYTPYTKLKTKMIKMFLK